MGVVLGSAVVPIALCVCWKKANKWGCIIGSIAGFVAGIVAWLVTTSSLNGGALTVTVSVILNIERAVLTFYVDNRRRPGNARR